MEKENTTLSFIGIGIGSIALLLALVHFWAGPFSPQPTLEQTVAEKAVAIKKATIAALKGEKSPAPEQVKSRDLDEILSIVTAVLGGLAIILGVIGYAKKEPMRVAGGAAILGGSAIAFQFLALALGAILIAILIVAVLGNLGIG
jgi:hypothetical protein